MTLAAFNQGTHPRFVEGLAIRLAKQIDWVHPGFEHYILNTVIPEVRTFYSKAYTTTEALRYPSGRKDNGYGQQVNVENKFKDKRDIKPQKYAEPEGKFPGMSTFTFTGIESYQRGDHVGITLQIDDANGEAINPNVPIGMENCIIKNGGVVMEGTIKETRLESGKYRKVWTPSDMGNRVDH